MKNLMDQPLLATYYQRVHADPQGMAFVALADLLWDQGEFTEAVAVCRKGLAANPQLVSGRLVLARSLLGLQQTDEALALVHSILQQHPKHPDANQLLVRLEGGAALAAPAAPLLAMAQPRLSGNPMATITMARLYAAQGHLDQAKNIYQQLLSREPQHPEAERELAALERRAT